MNYQLPFGIKKNEKVAIVGCHGKTSLMYALGDMCSKIGTVLLSTSTKIYMPKNKKISLSIFDTDKNIEKSNYKMIVKSVLNNKCIGFDENEINIIDTSYDFVIYEADGSRGLPLKYWDKSDPVIWNDTTMTIAVLPIYVYGMCVDESNTFRASEFINNYGSRVDEKVLTKMLSNEGVFHNSKNIRKLFINGCESSADKTLAQELCKYINKETGIDCYFGSVKEGIYDNCNSYGGR